MAVITNPGEHLFRHKHNKLKNKEWSTAGHTIDTDIVPDTDGSHSVGTQALAFSEGNLGTLRVTNVSPASDAILINMTQSAEYVQINQTATSGVEDQPLIYVNDDRTGTTANEAIEASLFLDADSSIYSLYIKAGSVGFGGSTYFYHSGGTTYEFQFNASNDFFKAADDKYWGAGSGGAPVGAPEFAWWYDTGDANAHIMMFALKNYYDVNDIPVFAFGDSDMDKDLGWFNGIIEPNIAVVDSDADSSVMLGYDVDDAPRIGFKGNATGIGVSGNLVMAGELTPDASGLRDVGTQAVAFSEGNFDTLRVAQDKLSGDHHFVTTIASSGTWGCAEVIPIWQAPRGSTVTINEVRATALGTSTPTYTFNIEERAWTSLNSAGTDLFGADQTATSGGVIITGLSNEGITAGAHLVFTADASADSGTVNYVTVAGYYTID